MDGMVMTTLTAVLRAALETFTNSTNQESISSAVKR
jgi:hypothetical protein